MGSAASEFNSEITGEERAFKAQTHRANMSFQDNSQTRYITEGGGETLSGFAAKMAILQTAGWAAAERVVRMVAANSRSSTEV